VAIPVVSVRLVKKHKTAGLVPNGLAITTDTGQKVNTSAPVVVNSNTCVGSAQRGGVCVCVCVPGEGAMERKQQRAIDRSLSGGPAC